MKIILQANTDWYLHHYRLSLLLSLRGAGHEVIVLVPPGDYVERIEKAGLRWEPLIMNRRSVNPFLELMVVLRQIRFLRRERPDILHNFTIRRVTCSPESES